MSAPLSPPPVGSSAPGELPAYLSNGLIGLRVRANPLVSGSMMLSGFTGEHPENRLEVSAPAPYPLAVDIAIDNTWMTDVPEQVELIEQAYDFEAAELTTRLALTISGKRAEIEVLTFCCRHLPTMLCQQVAVKLDQAAGLTIRSILDGQGIEGRPMSLKRDKLDCDGVLWWESAGGIASCGIAYSTQMEGIKVEPEPSPAIERKRAHTAYRFGATAGHTYRLRQFVSVVCSTLHRQAGDEAVRLLGPAVREGFDDLRKANRAAWAELWKSRIVLHGAEPRWQLLSDAAFYYLNASVHPATPASTSMFGLATWGDYDYYFGHVMWDIEAFALPPLTFSQPESAAALLGYRYRSLDAARRNARLKGRLGVEFPWQSAASSGEEASPLPGLGSFYEDHVSLDVALGFAFYTDVTDEARFAAEYAWPVVSGVADWLVSRASPSDRGYEFPKVTGIAETKELRNNSAYTNMAAKLVLRYAARLATRLGYPFNKKWLEIGEKLVLPCQGGRIVTYDDFSVHDEKGATPEPLLGIFPAGFRLEPGVERETLKFYLHHAKTYIGAPMLSELYAAWAAMVGDRRLALSLLEEGYGKFLSGRFCQTLEYRPDVFPDQQRAGPFLANIGGFLTGLLLGFTGIRPSDAEPAEWCERPPVLPEGWDAIEVERLFIRNRPMRLIARQGAERAELLEAG